MASAKETRKPRKAVQVWLTFLAIILLMAGIFGGVFGAKFSADYLHMEGDIAVILLLVIMFLPLLPGIAFADWVDRKCGGRGLSYGY